MIRLALPLIEDDDIEAVSDALRSGHLVSGARVVDFERRVATLAGTQHAVAVTNCTAALEIALKVLGIGRGDRVAVTTYSWISTANAIELVGATPVFVDIDPATFNMSPARLEAALSANDISAALPVHTFGNVRGIDQLAAIAEVHGVPLIEDAACALGARLSNRPAGSWGTLGCFSFHPRKAVTTGEGGVVVTNSAAHDELLRSLRNHGTDPAAATPAFVRPASNLRMTEFQAALGASQLTKLERVLQIRREVAARYERLLAGTGITCPVVGPEHILQSYVVLLPPGLPVTASDVVKKVRDAGVEVTVGTWHMPLAAYYRQRYGYRRGDFPATDEVFARALSLPLHHLLTSEDQAIVTKTLLDALSEP